MLDEPSSLPKREEFKLKRKRKAKKEIVEPEGSFDNRAPIRNTNIYGEFSCQDVWKMLDSYLWKKTTKRDIVQLLRLNPKHTFPVRLGSSTIHLPPYPQAIHQSDYVDEQLVFNLFPTQPVPSEKKKSTRATSTLSSETPLCFQGFNSSDVSRCREEFGYFIDEGVISWFHQNQYCVNTTVREATMKDIPRLLEVNTINPLYFKAEDLKSSMNAVNEFILVAERKNSQGSPVIVGMIHYYLIWYYPQTKFRKHSTANLPVPENVQPQKVVYVCTLQVVKKSTHTVYVRRNGVQSEYGLGKMLFCLACQHGLKTGMKYLLLDSTEGAVSFYTSVFNMQKNNVADRAYIPLQLKLENFNYRMVYNPRLYQDPRFTLHCTVFPKESQLAPQAKNVQLHIQYTPTQGVVHSSVVKQPPAVPLPSSQLQSLYTSSSPSELSLALSALTNYSPLSRTKVEEVDVDGHFLPLYNTSSTRSLLINEYVLEGKMHYDEVSVELVRLIDELHACMQKNYAISSLITDDMIQKMVKESQSRQRSLRKVHTESKKKEAAEEKDPTSKLPNEIALEDKPKRKRGRPPKNKPVAEGLQAPPRKRGRPPKVRVDSPKKLHLETPQPPPEEAPESDQSEEEFQSEEALSQSETELDMELVESEEATPKLKSMSKSKPKPKAKSKPKAISNPASEITVTNSDTFYKCFSIRQRSSLRVRLTDLVNSSGFSEIFWSGDPSLYTYLSHYYRGFPQEFSSRAGQFDMKALLECDNTQVLSLEQVLEQLKRSLSNSRRLVVLLYTLLTTSLFSVYPPHVIATTCGENNRLLARSPLIDLRKLCTLCNKLARLLTELNRCLEFTAETSKGCFCGEEVEHQNATLCCKRCSRTFHCSCLGLVPTAYPTILQTKYWGYWVMERGFVCPFCCCSELFEMSRVANKVVQIKDTVLHSWQSKRKS